MRAISRRATTAQSGCVVRLLGLVFLLVGSGIAFGLSGLPLLNWYGAQDWPAVPCTILSSEVLTHSSSDGTTYSIGIRYAYAWEGTPYESGEYNFFGGSSSGYDGKQAVVEQYPAGETRECYVNPENPSEAVLNRAFSLVYLIGCFGLIFVLVGFFMLFHRSRSAPTVPGLDLAVAPIASTSTSSSYTVSTGGHAIPEAAPEHGTIALKGGNNSVIGFVFLLIFAAIWNGIVLVAVWDSVGFGSGATFDFISSLFLTPFVLVGLALIFGVGYFFLSLFNPRPDLTLTPGYLPLGGTAALTWTFRGNASRIQKLTISVQGQEAATYRRGTSTSTDKSVFEKIVVCETEDATAIRSGEVSFTMPEFTAPSFNASNNKIQWQVKVNGSIHRWPDVNEEFELVVAPLPVPGGVVPQPAEFHVTGSGDSA